MTDQQEIMLREARITSEHPTIEAEICAMESLIIKAASENETYSEYLVIATPLKMKIQTLRLLKIKYHLHGAEKNNSK